MGVFLWVDSNTGPMELTQCNGRDKPPWCSSKPSKITTCFLTSDNNNKCNGKESKISWSSRNTTKSEPNRRNNQSDKCKINAEYNNNNNLNNRSSKLKIQEPKLSVHNKKKCGDKKKVKGVCYWKEYTAVVAVAFTSYMNAYLGDFVHDDIPAITHNRDVTGQTPILDVFKNDFWGAAMSDPSSHKSYRPLTTLSFR